MPGVGRTQTVNLRNLPVRRPVASARTLSQPLKTKLSAPKMGAFDRLVDETVADDRELMRGVHVVALQHLLGSTGSLLRSFTRLGAQAGDILSLGKRYSQKESVMAELRNDGFQIRAAVNENDGGLHGSVPDLFNRGLRTGMMLASTASIRTGVNRLPSRASELDTAIAEVKARVAATSGKVLVLDDGGELIERLQLEHPELHDRIVAVEQTRKGIRKIEKLKLGFPVIDVAQTWAKLQHESPMIGRSIARTSLDRLARLESAGVAVPRRILTIGHGAVGKAACASLREAGYEVAVYDRSPETRLEAKRAGYVVYDTLYEALAHGDVTLSMTGETTLDSEALRKLPNGAVLINGASSGTELMPNEEAVRRGLVQHTIVPDVDGARVIAPFRGKRIEIGRVDLRRDGASYGKLTDSLDYPLVLERRGEAPKELLLVRRGEVVNFSGNEDPIPARYIQLTRGLLFLGAVQAMKTAQPGIHAIPEAAQHRWVDAVQADLATTHESLDQPTF